MRKWLMFLVVVIGGGMLAQSALASRMTLTGRFGGEGAGDWEFSLGASPGGHPSRIVDWGWENGRAYPFQLGYDDQSGQITFTIFDSSGIPYSINNNLGAGQTLTSLELGVKVSPGQWGILGLQEVELLDGNNQTVFAPGNLIALGGGPFNFSPTVTTDLQLTGDWRLDGQARLGWLGRAPSGSRLNFQIMADTALDPALDPPLDPPVDNSGPAPVPEPGTILLLGLGIGSLAAFRKAFGSS